MTRVNGLGGRHSHVWSSGGRSHFDFQGTIGRENHRCEWLLLVKELLLELKRWASSSFWELNVWKFWIKFTYSFFFLLLIHITACKLQNFIPGWFDKLWARLLISSRLREQLRYLSRSNTFLTWLYFWYYALCPSIHLSSFYSFVIEKVVIIAQFISEWLLSKVCWILKFFSHQR